MRVRYSFSSRHVRNLDTSNAHKEAFPKIVGELVDKCEIILEILDSRFIEETRNPEIEKLILAKGKRLIYVLNKSDLADVETAKSKAESLGLYPFVLISVVNRKGSSELRERIKIESKKLKEEHPKTNIGVIGYPNTGKSSIINMLVGRNVARTAPEAGFTKGIQKLKLSENIMILDTPGVIPDKKYSMSDLKKMSTQTKISARNYDKIKQPEFAVNELMKEYPQVLETYYDIKADGDSELLIEKSGKFSFLEYSPEKVRVMLEEGGGEVESIVLRKKITRIVIDSVTSFALLFEDDLKKREAALSLFGMLRKWGCTTLLTYEEEPSRENKLASNTLGFESDSIIVIYFERTGKERKRYVEVLKMRGTKHSREIYPLQIEKKGVSVGNASYPGKVG